MTEGPDILIVGSGMGGATLAAALAPTGHRIVILERGDHLRRSVYDRDENAIFAKDHYRPNEEWLDGDGQAFDRLCFFRGACDLRDAHLCGGFNLISQFNG